MDICVCSAFGDQQFCQLKHVLHVLYCRYVTLQGDHCLENLEMSGNLEHVREMSGKKSCHGKVSQNCSLLDEY